MTRDPAGGLAVQRAGVRLAGVAGVLLIASALPVGSQLPSASPAPSGGPQNETAPAEQEEVQPPAAEDPTRTAGGALRLFMASRDYRTIKRLKSVMTDRLQARFDHDSAPFNGKRSARLAAFDFTEKDLKPARPAAGRAGAQPVSYLASVRSLWAEQGEATELRTESVTITEQPDGLWRIADLALSDSDRLRFGDAVPGVTALRMVLRAWYGGSVAGARSSMSEGFLKKFAARDDALKALFSPPAGKQHAAYQIVEMEPKGTSAAVSGIKLYETVIGEPGPIDGAPHSLRMVKKGSRWLLDGWD